VAAIWAVSLAGAMLLLGAGAGHLRSPRWVRASLEAQRVLPAGWHGALARLLGPIELALAAVVLLGWFVAPVLLRVGLAAAAVLWVAFAGYLAVVLRRTPGAPCGCFGQDRVSWWAVGRVAVLACATVATMPAATPDEGRPVILVASVMVALMLWLLPQLAEVTPRAVRQR
jgi:Methylamine utilisation protein MauE